MPRAPPPGSCRFYTLMVLSTALFDKPAFKNLVCNGLVLAADGKKMSKSLRNYPPPEEVITEYGADALRLYLTNSPVVRAEPLRFQKEGVFGIVKARARGPVLFFSVRRAHAAGLLPFLHPTFPTEGNPPPSSAPPPSPRRTSSSSGTTPTASSSRTSAATRRRPAPPLTLSPLTSRRRRTSSTGGSAPRTTA